MLTQFGKFCRKLRIDNNELLKDMAIKLEVTSSYLSAVENGKRNVPQDWVEKITELYELDSEQTEELKKSADESQKVVKINFDEYDREDKDILMALARQLKSLDDDEKTKIKKILRSNKKGGV